MGLDYYAILNISRCSNTADIDFAYRTWAMASHPYREAYPRHPENPPHGLPDEILHLPGVPRATIWAYVNEAYDILSDRMLREIYDRFGEEGLKRGTSAPVGYVQAYCYHGDFMRTYADAMGTESPYADLIDAVTYPPPLYTVPHGKGVIEQDLPLELELPVTLHDVFFGTTKPVPFERAEFTDKEMQSTAIRQHVFEVPVCVGVKSGTRITFPRAGHRNPKKVPSDIVFIIVDTPHPVYKRNGDDLYMECKVNLHQALCGVVVDVTTLDDRKFSVPITDVIRPGYVKTVPEEGLPVQGQWKCKGNLYISFCIEFPGRMSRSCLEKMDELLKGNCSDEMKS